MAWTQQDIEKLEKAIASGKLSVRYKDRQITYQSTAAMMQALKVMRTEAAAAAGTSRRRIYRVTQTGTGLS